MQEKEKNTNLSELGEFAFIDHITKGFKLANKSSKLGIGDDAALIKNEDCTVVSTDLLVENVHFDMIYTPMKHLGYKAVVVNLSDIYAMNAMPEQITVSIAISSKYTLEAVEELYSGIQAACEAYDVDLVGGDTTTSVTGLTISITAIGSVKESNVVKRSGASNSDLICVTGDLGAAYLGLQILEREKLIFKDSPKVQPDLEGHDYIIERMLKPEARKDIIKSLAEIKVQPTAMIDISDGLASELHHICKQSKVGCTIYDDKLPIDSTVLTTALDLNLPPTTCALSGGEDYELLFTIKLDDYDKIKNHSDITIIGHITEKAEGLQIITKTGTQHKLEAQGWNHFK